MQKIPTRKKTTKRKLDEREIELKNEYYKEILRFYEKNDKCEEENNNQKIYNTNYIQNQFEIINYDHNKFESYGVINNKRLFLNMEEAFYLSQLNVIKLEAKIVLENFDISKNFLYGYLRRSGKIVTCSDYFKKEEDRDEIFLKDYYLVFETLEDFRKKNLSSIIKCFNKENFNFEILEIISKEAEFIVSKFMENNNVSNNSDREEYKICIGFVSGAMTYILSIKDICLDNNF